MWIFGVIIDPARGAKQKPDDVENNF